MKAGDLVRHKTNTASTALILGIFMTNHELESRNEEWAAVLFSGELTPSQAPLQLLKNNWEVISEI